MTDTTVLTIRLEPEVEARLTAAARDLQRSPGELVGEAIAAWLDLQAWQTAEIERALAEADAGDFADDAEVEAVFRRWNT
jgi:RHH-type transcriptional regulator, rel operon repressor / antitoxin RelB